MKSTISLYILCGLALFGCRQTKESTAVTGKLTPASGASVVTAEILDIYDERSTIPPCDKVACLAKVKIVNIEHHSGDFQQPLASGQEGKMRFEFTLVKTTKALFPNLDQQFPGLKEGDRFKTNIKEELLLGSQKTQWVAYEYILLP